MTAKDYLRQPYARVVIPDESGGFTAEILEFPGCFAEGDTVEEAYKDLESAAESWIDAHSAQGHEIPAPFSNLGYSGTISLRLPRTIHKRATIMAEPDRTSLNSFLLTAIASRVGAEDFYTALADKFEHSMMSEAANIQQTLQSHQGMQQAQTLGRNYSPQLKMKGDFDQTASIEANIVAVRRRK